MKAQAPRVRVALLLGVAAAAPARLAAQHPHALRADSAAAFAVLVRDATVRYQDPAVASADGYRPIGPDFPGMGQHWLSVGRLVGGRVAAPEPQILEYAPTGEGGRPTLVGVAYAALVTDSAVPVLAPVPRGAWHFHAGTVDEESFIRGHADSDASGGGGPRIAVLHAWVWLANPAGLFATDNWALPFAELGLVAPPEVPPAAGMALSLAVGGDRYYEAAVRAVGSPDSADAARTRAVLAHCRAKVGVWVARARDSADAGRDLAPLVELWRGLWVELEGAVSPAVAGRLRAWRDR